MTTHNLNDTQAFISRHNTELTSRQIRGFLLDVARGDLDGMRVSADNEELVITHTVTTETGPWFEIKTVPRNELPADLPRRQASDTMPQIFDLLDWLQANDFIHNERPDHDGDWLEARNVRVALNDDVVVCVFDDESLSIEIWDARFRCAPTAVNIAAIEAAFETLP